MRRIGRQGVVLGVAAWLAAGPGQAQVTTFAAASLASLPGSTGDATGISVLADVGSLAGPPDGIPDLLTALQSREVAVRWGGGNFSAGTTVFTDGVPSAMAAGDLNGDGQPDLVLGDNGNALSVFLNNGNGEFLPAGEAYSLPFVPRGLAIGRFNGDAVPDVVAVGDDFAQVGLGQVFLGEGDGELLPVLETLSFGLASSSVAVADVDRDGRLDLAVGNEGSDTVDVLRGDGTGGFAALARLAVGFGPVAVGLEDLNADGFPDLLTANSLGDDVSVRLGSAGGNFGVLRSFPAGSSTCTPRGLAVADVDGDGRQDVVVANNFSFDVGILFGDGAGALSPPRLFVADAEPVGVSAGDVDGDGRGDVLALARGRDSSPTVAFLRSIPGRRLRGVENVIVSRAPLRAVVADLDADGLSDLVVAEPASNGQPTQLELFHSTGETGFGSPQRLLPPGNAGDLASGDFNGDGRSDLVVTDSTSARVLVFLARAGAGWSDPTEVSVDGVPASLTVGDWNRDGREDLAVVLRPSGGAGVLQILVSQASGTWSTLQRVEVGDLPVAVASADLDRDGLPDLVVANGGSANLSVVLASATGGFLPATSVGLVAAPRSLAVADFDRDGFDDVAVGLSVRPEVSVLFGDGTGRFPFVRAISLGGSDSPSGVAARDVDGDGAPDLVIAGEVSSTVRVHRRQAAPNVRAFTGAESFTVNRRPLSMATGDFDGDGRYDAAVACGSPAPTASVLTNVRAVPGRRGDGNGDRRVSAADLVAVARKVADGSRIRVEDVAVRGGFVAAAGIDADADGVITRADALSTAAWVFRPAAAGI